MSDALNDWQPIETAPRTGAVVYLKCAAHPEWREQLLGWNADAGRWQGYDFAPMARRVIFWDLDVDQPTHWRRFPADAAARASSAVGGQA